MRNILWALLLTPGAALADEPAAIHVNVETSAISVSGCAAGNPGDTMKNLFFPCEVTNVANNAISALSYGATIYEPGRTIQWMPEDEYPRHIGKRQIRGGIEPGETITVLLAVRRAPDRADPSKIEFTMRFTEAFDANGDPIE